MQPKSTWSIFFPIFLLTCTSFYWCALHLCEPLIIWEWHVANALTRGTIFRPFHLRPFVLVICFLVLFARKRRQETRLTKLSHTIYKMINVVRLQWSAYRFFWTTEDASRTMMPANTAPMTTPNTMSHGGVSGLTGAARVGMMSMNSRVLSVSRKALLIRLLDFLLGKIRHLDYF